MNDDEATVNDIGGMSEIGVSRLIGHCQRIGILPRTTDQDDALAQVYSWAQVLPVACTLQFAQAVADTWSEPRPITPIAIKSRWDDHARAQRAAQPRETYVESACAWARFCVCTHDGCWHGHLVGSEDLVTTISGPKGSTERITTAVRWCPTCWEARNRARMDKGKEARVYGDLTP